MIGGSDVMFSMFLGGGKGDMAGGCCLVCLVCDGMMHGGKDPSCPQFRAGFSLNLFEHHSRDQIFSRIASK